MAIENNVLPSLLLNVPDPAESIRKSVQAGLQIGQSQQQAQAAIDAHNAAQQQAQLAGIQIQGAQQTVDATALQQQRTLALRAAWAKESQNPTPQGMTQILTQFPEAAEMVSKASGALDEQQVKQLTPIVSAMLTKHPDIANSEIEKAATTWDNMKNPQRAQQLRDTAARYAKDPQGTAMNTTAALAVAMGPKTFAEQFGKLMGTQPAQEKAEADAAVSKNALTVSNAGLPYAKSNAALENATKKTGAAQAEQTLADLPTDVRTSVKEDTKSAVESQDLQGRLQDVYDTAQKMKLAGGLPETLGQFLKQAAYGGDKFTDLHNRVNQMMAGGIMGNLKSAGGKTGEALIDLGKNGIPLDGAASMDVVLPVLQRAIDAAKLNTRTAGDSAAWQGRFRGGQTATKDTVLPSGLKVKQGDDYTPTMLRNVPVIPQAEQPSQPTEPLAQIRTYTTLDQIRAHRARVLAEDAAEKANKAKGAQGANG